MKSSNAALNQILNQDYIYQNQEELSVERMIEIEKTVQKILQDSKFHYSSYVNIVPLVKKEHFSVIKKQLPINTTGVLIVNDKKDKNERVIVVNSNFQNLENEDDLLFKKSRYVTAHEFGHYKLHKKKNKRQLVFERNRDSIENDIQELEAEYFARSILMPFEYFKKAYNTLMNTYNHDEGVVVGYLSNIFKVTKNKVHQRIYDIAKLNDYM